MSGPAAPTLLRFTLSTRLLHWLNAVTFLALLISGLLIYIPSLKAHEIGGYRLLPLLHIIFGVAFLLAPALLLALVRQRRALVSDVADALTPAPRDIGWLNYAVLSLLGARVRAPRTGKFNAGQKLNTWFWVLSWLALGATGIVLTVNFFTKEVFDAAFVESVFPVHELIALAAIFPLAGHLYIALVNRSTRPALPGIFGGRVDARWAREHHADWVESATK